MPALRPAVLSCLLATEFLHAAGSAVINEFHYNSENEASLEEFIELHNPGDAPYDLTGHSIQDAVTFTFPSGTTIPAGGYLIIAKDPAVMSAKFGVSALGPWSGNLSSGGEEIELRNAANAKVDSVDYKAGFPWPSMTDGGGPSAELINTGLDNSLGSSWRSAQGTANAGSTYIPLLADDWKYKKGITEASSPADGWRAVTYDDAAWSSGQAAIGYDEDEGNGIYDGINIPLDDMRNSYSSVYLRKHFTLPAGSIPDSLKLAVSADDGYIVWINGIEVARVSVGSGEIAYNATSAVHNFTAPENFTLTNTSAYLVPGDNVVTVHVLNAALTSSDLYFDLSLSGVAGNMGASIATPGALNSSSRPLAQTPPAVASVVHTPQQPLAGETVVVTASISDPDGVGSVTLDYQTVNPGAYIRKTDAAYTANWTTETMNDSGTGGDATAGDGVYSVTLPASLQTNRRLVRYRVTATDSLGNSQRFPYEDDEQPNFAYFVYNGIPAWSGALRPSAFNGSPATAAVNYTQQTMRSMPAVHLIANQSDVTGSQYSNAYYKIPQYGTVVQNGIVYDHVTFRNRGQGSTYVSGKNKWKFNFNRARDYQAYDNYGRPYQETWNELPLNSNAGPWVSVHRGSAGIEEASSHRLYQLAGMAAMGTQYLQLRVIDAAAEAPADQFGGDLWGLYMGFEPTEGNFIDEHGLEDGNLYDIAGGAGDKQRQGPAPYPEDDSDWVAFRNGVTQSGQTEQWYRDHVDLPTLYTFLAINRLLGNVDVRPGDNYRFYHRPDGRWVIIPYDLDMMYLPAHHWGGNMDGMVVAGAPDVFRAIMRHPAIAMEYRNRCREILSLAGSDGTPGGGQIGQLLTEYAGFVSPPGAGGQTWANIDAAMWNLHPRTAGNGADTGQSSHKGNFFRATYRDGGRGGLGGTVATGTWLRTLPDADGDGFSDHAGLTQWFIDYATNTWTPNTPGEIWSRKALTGIGSGDDTANLTRQKGYGYKYLEFEALNGGWGNANANPGVMPLFNDFPAKPSISADVTEFRTDDLRFTASTFSDPQGAGTHAATQWRIAQISSPGVPGYVAGEPWKYELQGWTSGELAPGSAAFTFPLGIVDAGKRYRVRARYKDTSGNWSYWSDPVMFDAAVPLPLTLVHYWNFNGSNTTPASTLLGGTQTTGGTIAYATGESFAGLNARNGDASGAHQRVNSPLTAGSQLHFNLPTTGYKDLIFRYETRRSGSGAGTQKVAYTPDGGTTWVDHSNIVVADVGSTSQVPVQTLDFRSVTDARDNPLFGIRITFEQGTAGTGGNNRFDNVTLEGRSINPTFASWSSHFFTPAELADPAISGPNADPAGLGITNFMRFAMGLSRTADLIDPSGASVVQSFQTNGSQKTFRFRYNPAATGLVWRVQAGNSPGDWTHVLLDSGTTTPVVSGGWVTVTLPATLNGAGTDPHMFVRLQVTTP